VLAADALEIAGAQDPPDLVLLDIMMPEMDGYEVCRRLKADPRTKDVPVIFVTAMSEVDDETRGFSLGGTASARARRSCRRRSTSAAAWSPTRPVPRYFFTTRPSRRMVS
jgi:CheY-like chemotaxis protein